MYKFYLKSLLLLKHNLLVSIILILCLALLCVLILSKKTFDNDIATMLPENSEAQKTLRFINTSNLANKIIISLHLKDYSYTLNDLQKQIQLLADRLDSPLIDKVDYKLSAASPLDELEALTPCLPQMLGKSTVDRLEKSMNPSETKKIVNSLYQRLISPAGLGQSTFISGDPFGLKNPILKKIQTLKNIWGFKMAPGQNYFISRDLHNGMLILQTNVRGTNTFQSKKLIAVIQKQLDTLPQWISADIISSHLRALSNEKVIKKDIKFTLILSFIGFILLFAIFYKYDFRCLLIMLLPILATLFVLTGMTLIFDKTLLFVVGLGGVVVGIAVDYGIHIYSAMASGRHFRGAVRVIRPLVAGGLTTFGVFAVFMFSDTPGYHQLGVFAGFSIILSLLFSILFLPVLFANANFPRFSTEWLCKITENLRKYPYIIFACWFVLIIFSTYLFSQIRFADDLQQLDGSKAEIEDVEKRFQKIWQSTERPAILAISRESMEAAAKDTEATCAILRIKTEGQFFCATDIWPSATIRKENLSHFKRFAAEGKLRKLEEQLDIQAREKGFMSNSFTPFFNALRDGIKNAEKQKLPMMFQTLVNQLCNSKNGNHTFFIFFPDKANLVQDVRSLSSKSNNTFVISRNAFRQMLSEVVMTRIFTLVCIALLVVVIVTFLLMRKVTQTFLALLPVLSAIIITGGFFVLFSIPVNAAACIGAIVVIGLAIDYGIFMTNELNEKCKSNVLPAISLSSLTTLIGAGAIIFAIHPMLRSVGFVLCFGVFTAWLTSIAVIPAIWELFKKNKVLTKSFFHLFIIFIMLSGVGCSTTNPFKRSPLPLLPDKKPDQLLENFRKRQSRSFSALSGIVFNWHSQKVSSLCVVKVNHTNRKISVLGMNLMGVKLFEAAGDAQKAKLLFSALDMKLKRPNAFAEIMIKDISRIYFDKIPTGTYSIIREDKEIIFSSFPSKSQVFKYYFGGSPVVLLKKQAFDDNSLLWQIDYYNYKKNEELLIPHSVFLQNKKYDYYLEIRLKELTSKE